MISVDVMCIVHSYNMGDKMRMTVTFEYICQKEWSCLTYVRIVHLFIMYQTLYDYDYHLKASRPLVGFQRLMLTQDHYDQRVFCRGNLS